ncbi:MAG: 3-deoxy-D-manno-octulosonic acid transferase [Desulfobacter sp.]|nr:3-deoxy-D-manno-octulosonic acid transferase [Desulfobacter sp.]WDP86541.1 MAG: 3-deoxy-D-manno-octulosonic acid transferase [Desulfobacter sp.]
MRAYAPMTKCAFIPNFFKFYNILWQAGLPFLKRNPRICASFSKRTRAFHLQRADIWIQAASAGEAFLALSIIKNLKPDHPTTLLVTTTTDQGFDILKQGLGDLRLHPNIQLRVDWFPFDIPDTVKEAVKRVNPKVMVLLETELWPALLYELKINRTKILILNARLSKSSHRNYKATKALWNRLAPDTILTTSFRDAQRYTHIFPDARVGRIENIKFDIMETGPQKTKSQPCDLILPKDLPLSILASVRRQEEPEMVKLISALKKGYPNQVITVFPRHMHRIKKIQKKLTRAGLSFCLRSTLNSPLTGPGIILWDQFGELRSAYGRASAVFVGGSLHPLGGQNFIEPAVLGIPTVIGPYWEDFAWVGKEIFNLDLVTQCHDWTSVAQTMIALLNTPKDPLVGITCAQAYIDTRKGGSKTACKAILDKLG